MRCASLTKAQLHFEHRIKLRWKPQEQVLQLSRRPTDAVVCSKLAAHHSSARVTLQHRQVHMRRCIARPCTEHSFRMRCIKATIHTASAPGAVGSGLMCCFADPFIGGSEVPAVPSAARRWTSMHCVSLLQKPHASAPAARSAALSERYSDGDTPLSTSASSFDDELAAAIACTHALNVDHRHEI